MSVKEILTKEALGKGGTFIFMNLSKKILKILQKFNEFKFNREDFTEFGIATSGRVENLFLNVQEEMELKMAAHHYLQFRGRGQVCSDDVTKSTSLCRENCIWYQVEMAVQCSGPWVRNRSTIDCHNYEDIRRMTVAYKK